MHNIPTIHYSAGEVILREGDPSNSVFMIISGRIEITKRSGSKDIVLKQQGKNTIFGEMSLIDGKRRSATAIALEETYCHRCDTLTVISMLNKIDIELIHALKSLVSMIRQNNHDLVISQKDDTGIEKFDSDNALSEGSLVEGEDKPMTLAQIMSKENQDKINNINIPFIRSLFRVLIKTASN